MRRTGLRQQTTKQSKKASLRQQITTQNKKAKIENREFKRYLSSRQQIYPKDNKMVNYLNVENVPNESQEVTTTMKEITTANQEQQEAQIKEQAIKGIEQLSKKQLAKYRAEHSKYVENQVVQYSMLGTDLNYIREGMKNIIFNKQATEKIIGQKIKVTGVKMKLTDERMKDAKFDKETNEEVNEKLGGNIVICETGKELGCKIGWPVRSIFKFENIIQGEKEIFIAGGNEFGIKGLERKLNNIKKYSINLEMLQEEIGEEEYLFYPPPTTKEEAKFFISKKSRNEAKIDSEETEIEAEKIKQALMELRKIKEEFDKKMANVPLDKLDEEIEKHSHEMIEALMIYKSQFPLDKENIEELCVLMNAAEHLELEKLFEGKETDKVKEIKLAMDEIDIKLQNETIWKEALRVENSTVKISSFHSYK